MSLLHYSMTLFGNYDICWLWRISVIILSVKKFASYDVCRLWHLWHLSPIMMLVSYDVCRLWRLSIIMFVTYEVFRQLWRLSLIRFIRITNCVCCWDSYDYFLDVYLHAAPVLLPFLAVCLGGEQRQFSQITRSKI